jgi:hypothetical protein
MKKQLKALEKKELYALLLELAALRKENAEFLELRLKKNDDDSIKYYKMRVKNALFQEKINLREARKAVTDFKKVCDKTEYILDLMVFYVEVGVKIGEEYGDIYEAFYMSMESMFHNVIKMLNKNPTLTLLFKERLDSILDRSCEGWGHKDTLEEMYEDLSAETVLRNT